MNNQALTNGWPAALRLLATLAGFQREEAGWPRLADAVTDWDEFLQLAARHRLAPAIYPVVQGRTLLPPGVVTAIRNAFEQNRLAALQRLRELLRVHAALARQNIPSLSLKGVLAGLQIHGDPALRHAGDLDVLIQPADFMRADRVLAELGYRSRSLPGPISESLLPWVIGRYCDKEYVHAVSGNVLELHWRLTVNPQLLPVSTGEIFNQARTVRTGGQSIRVLSAGHELLFLCVHGAKHRWSRLFWLRDVARLLSSPPGNQDAAGLFAAHRLSRVLHQAALLAEDCLGASLLPSVRAAAGADATAGWLARRAAESLLAPVVDLRHGTVRDRLAGHAYALALRGGAGYLAEQVRHAALSQEDWRELRLPSGWERLYYGLRPALWLRRKWRGTRADQAE